MKHTVKLTAQNVALEWLETGITLEQFKETFGPEYGQHNDLPEVYYEARQRLWDKRHKLGKVVILDSIIDREAMAKAIEAVDAFLLTVIAERGTETLLTDAELQTIQEIIEKHIPATEGATQQQNEADAAGNGTDANTSGSEKKPTQNKKRRTDANTSGDTEQVQGTEE